MGDAASSAFLQTIFQTALNFLIEELRLEHDLQKEIQDLKKNVAMISATLNKADKSDPSQRLKLWLDELRDVGYEAIDLLDDHNTELQRQKSVQFSELRNKLAIINPKRVNHRHDMSHKIQKLSDEMHRVFERRINFDINVIESSSARDKLEVTASLPPTHIVGRDDEKNYILNKLISNDDVQVRESKLKILAIHGMGRIGKTTLAQLIYNDERKPMHFDMRLWVHVSCDFDLEKVTHSILNSMGELSSRDINFDTSQRRIQNKLNGKRYLLVLDDFWNEKPHEWEKLIRPLYKGSPESVIIVTTRTRKVAEMVSTFLSYHLKEIPDSDCYSLVSHYASRDDITARSRLDALRSEIITKCRGMPEDAINLGYQLRQEDNIEKWREIIVKWGEGHAFPEERNVFINSMKLTYSRLPSNLKPCLAYCSIIPKGFKFSKEWIVQLWMALSFIVKQNDRGIEDLGNEYFDWLVERSFFQRTRNDLNVDQYEYCIPDPIHEIARYASAEECCIFEVGKSNNPTNTTRHMSIVLTRGHISYNQDPFTTIYHCKGLYTLLVFGGDLINHPLQFSDDFFNNLQKLRILDLSCCNIALPTSIGNLKHLRYLQLRNSKIKELPESVCDLYNLQTLGLRNCYHLNKLPKRTKYLKKLRHLDLHLDYLPANVDETIPSLEILESMPPKIGLLTNLQVLSRFVVSTTSHCGIDELRNLNNLQGELSISNLDLVTNPDDAANANLHKKTHITRLDFLWRGDKGLLECNKDKERTELVLEKLKPSSTIKELNIVHYKGEFLPSWIRSADFSNLRSILLSDCPNCILLQPLGNLPMLKDLHIKGIRSLIHIDCEFCGNNPIHFPSLKKLIVENMMNLEKWTGNENCELHLNELVLKDCTMLQRLTHKFPSLTKLTIENLPSFLGLRQYPSLKYLKVVACGNWINSSLRCLSLLSSLTLSHLSSETLPVELPKMLNYLRSLEINHCIDLTMLPDNWIPSSVTSLCIRQCPMLRQLPKGLETLKTLEDLEIQDCKDLKVFPELRNLKSLTRLEISGCDSFEFLPRDGLPHALHFLSISNCPKFTRNFGDFQNPDRIKIQHISSAWIDHKHFASIDAEACSA